MLISSVILFGIAALGGIVLAALGLKHRDLPMALSLIHGIVAAAALVLLIISVVQGVGGTLSVIALVLFVVAALGGFVLFSFHLRNKALPSALIIIHAIVAVIAFVLLLLAVV